MARPRDQSITPAHLLDGCLHDLAHTLAHLDRLNDPEVQKDPAAVAFNAAHAQHHALGTQDHAVRIADFLSEHASDPAEFAKQLKQLQDARRKSIKNEKPDSGPGETEKSWYLPGPRLAA